MIKSFEQKLAFTLAEIMIVLGIIGVIAEMTIPTLMQNVQKQVYSTSLKKAYVNFNEVLTQLTTDNGCIGDLACTGLFATADHLTLGEALAPYFKVIKNCKTTTSTGCFTSAGSHSYTSNGSEDWDAQAAYKFITADGMAYWLVNSGNNCANNWSTEATGNMSQFCGQVYIDVNGPTKSPNRLGRDIFVFYITNAKGPLLYPFGGKDHLSAVGGVSVWWKDPADETKIRYCDPSGTASPNWGAPCTGRIMEESWQMNY